MSLSVGAAKKSINPPKEMYPIPGLRTDFDLPPMHYEEIYDDCDCRAIAIETEGQKYLFLTFEIAGVSQFPDYTALLAEKTGVPEQNIFLFATHNHTAPDSRDKSEEAQEWVRKNNDIQYQAGIEACREAISAMRPAKWGYGETQSYININRNLKTFGGYTEEARNPAGYSDRTLSILKFTDEDGKLIAAFLNHATHATCNYMLRDIDHKAKTSGNFTGIACRFVEQYFGNGAVAMWTSGAAGDQNPQFSHGLQYEYPDGWTTQVQYPDGTGYMMMEYMGRYHGADCVRGIEKVAAVRTELPVRHVMTHIPLPARTPRDYEWPPKNFGMVRDGGFGVRDYEKVPYGNVPAPIEEPPMKAIEPKDLQLHLLLLGDVAMYLANAELYSAIGKAMKEASPYKNTVIVTHHKGPKVGYVFDEGSKDILLPMSLNGVVPGVADKLIVDGERELVDSLYR